LNTKKKVLVSFADQRLSSSLRRLRSQALELEFFDHLYFLTENDLSESFVRKFGDKLNSKFRGFGYWCWKPEVISMIFDSLDEGDILLYIDVGCHLNKFGLDRLKFYFNITESSPSGVLAFDGNPPSTDSGLLISDSKWLNHVHPNYKWIKGDLLARLDVLNDHHFLESPMIHATTIFFKKTENSKRLIEEWKSIILENFSYIDDNTSVIPNIPGFIEHRHDQALFSILGYKYKISTLSTAEIYFPSLLNDLIPNWEVLKSYPIHAKRDKKFRLSLIDEIKNVKSVLRNVTKKIFRAIGYQICNIDQFSIYQSFSIFVKHICGDNYKTVLEILINLNYKEKGYFVEVNPGSNNSSNTFVLEKHFGWEGIIVEPLVHWHNIITRDRSSSTLVKNFISSNSNLEILINEDKYSEEREINFKIRNQKYFPSNYIVVSISLIELFSKFNVPQNIDFISIRLREYNDNVFSNFNFDKYKFHLMLIEFHDSSQKCETDNLLSQKGYRRVFNNMNENKELYAYKR
jgi:hypothetical protein